MRCFLVSARPLWATWPIAAGVSWKAYTAIKSTQSGYIYNPFRSFSSIYEGSDWGTKVVSVSNFVTDALAGNLPALSWVTPPSTDTDHPPDSACVGENWTVQQINAVMQGPAAQWNSTVIVLVWDDLGGFYDHAPPPYRDQYRARACEFRSSSSLRGQFRACITRKWSLRACSDSWKKRSTFRAWELRTWSRTTCRMHLTLANAAAAAGVDTAHLSDRPADAPAFDPDDLED